MAKDLRVFIIDNEDTGGNEDTEKLLNRLLLSGSTRQFFRLLHSKRCLESLPFHNSSSRAVLASRWPV